MPTPAPLRVEGTRVAILTPRELQVVRSLAQAFTYAQTAARLGMSAHTVTSHIKNLYRKLDVHCAAAAVMRAIELGLLGEPRTGLAFDEGVTP